MSLHNEVLMQLSQRIFHDVAQANSVIRLKQWVIQDCMGAQAMFWWAKYCIGGYLTKLVF